MKLIEVNTNPKTIDEKIENLRQYITYLKTVKPKYKNNIAEIIKNNKIKLDKLIKHKNKCL